MENKPTLNFEKLSLQELDEYLAIVGMVCSRALHREIFDIRKQKQPRDYYPSLLSTLKTAKCRLDNFRGKAWGDTSSGDAKEG